MTSLNQAQFNELGRSKAGHHADSELERLYATVQAMEVMKEIQPTISVQAMLSFFYVRILEHEEGEASVKQISQRLSMVSSQAAKAVKSHKAITRNGTVGSRLLKTMENPSNRQSTLVQMTVKGEKALAKALGSKSSV